MLAIHDDLALPERELTYRMSRSSGPGGQNVNKVETRVTLLFSVAESTVLTEVQKERLRLRLATRMNRDGVLRVVSQKHRTQKANREAARIKLAELVADALKTKLRRRPTTTPKRAKRKRLEDKKRRGDLKRRRGPVHDP